MTELGLILGINCIGLALAVALVRWLFARDGGSAEARRVGAALERAAFGLLGREHRLVALATGPVALTLLLGHGLAWRGTGLSPFEAGFWAAVGVAVGAVSSSAVAHLSARIGLGAALRVIPGARISVDRALTVSIRAGTAVALLVETLSLLTVCCVFGLVYAIKGGFALGPDAAGALASQVARLMPSVALGAGTGALILHGAGTTFHTASDVGGDIAGERDAGLDQDDRRNPAVVSELSGDHLGAGARGLDLLVAATCANVAAIVIGSALFEANRAGVTSVLALLALPLLVRTFGLIATGFGAFVVRAGEQTGAAAALLRGQLTSSVICLGGLAGAAYWLLGPTLWLPFVGAGALGLAATTAAAHLGRLHKGRRSASVKDLLDALRVADVSALAQGLGLGLQGSVISVALVGAAAIGAFRLGELAGLAGGGLLGSLLALMTGLAAAPYLLAVAALGPITDCARGLRRMSSEELDGDAERRSQRLDEVGASTAVVAHTFLVLVGALSALLCAAALPLLSAPSAGMDPSHPVVIWCGGLGAAGALAYAGGAMRRSARGARGVALEVERQLRGFPRSAGLAQVPEEFSPSYRACLDVAAKSALERALPTALVAISIPALLGIGLRLLYRSAGPSVPIEGLTAFVAVAAVTSLSAALGLEGARAALLALRRAHPVRGSSSGYAASVSIDAVGDLLGNSAAPASHLYVKAAAAAALALAPFLS